jgi:hypothetical protein
MKISHNLFEEFDIYAEIIRYNKLDDKIRNKWCFPDWPNSKEDIEYWKIHYPEKYKGFWDDIKKLAVVLKLPQDRIDYLGLFVGQMGVRLHGNKINTKVENNQITGKPELWIQINKLTSINDIRSAWKNIIKPKQKELHDRIFNPDDFKFDKRVYELKIEKLPTDDIINKIEKEFGISIDYKLINDAYCRYKKIVTISPEELSIF